MFEALGWIPEIMSQKSTRLKPSQNKLKRKLVNLSEDIMKKPQRKKLIVGSRHEANLMKQLSDFQSELGLTDDVVVLRKIEGTQMKLLHPKDNLTDDQAVVR